MSDNGHMLYHLFNSSIGEIHTTAPISTSINCVWATITAASRSCCCETKQRFGHCGLFGSLRTIYECLPKPNCAIGGHASLKDLLTAI